MGVRRPAFYMPPASHLTSASDVLTLVLRFGLSCRRVMLQFHLLGRFNAPLGCLEAAAISSYAMVVESFLRFLGPSRTLLMPDHK